MRRPTPRGTRRKAQARVAHLERDALVLARMMSRIPAWISLLALVVSSAAGCVPRRVGPDPVPAGQWCDAYASAFCVWEHDSCTEGLAVPPGEDCARQGAAACLGGRGRGATTGRSYDQLNACIDYLEALDCHALGMTRTDGSALMYIDRSRLPAELHQRCGLDG